MSLQFTITGFIWPMQRRASLCQLDRWATITQGNWTISLLCSDIADLLSQISKEDPIRVWLCILFGSSSMREKFPPNQGRYRHVWCLQSDGSMCCIYNWLPPCNRGDDTHYRHWPVTITVPEISDLLHYHRICQVKPIIENIFISFPRRR